MRSLPVTILLLTCIFFLPDCGGKSPEKAPKDCIEIIPDNLPGLKVTGSRSKDNVIRNLIPFNCTVQKAYRERLAENTALTGEVTISFTVEFQGEVINNRIVTSTVEDTVFMEEFRQIYRYMEFDPWGNTGQETDVIYTYSLH